MKEIFTLSHIGGYPSGLTSLHRVSLSLCSSSDLVALCCTEVQTRTWAELQLILLPWERRCCGAHLGFAGVTGRGVGGGEPRRQPVAGVGVFLSTLWKLGVRFHGQQSHTNPSDKSLLLRNRL